MAKKIEYFKDPQTGIMALKEVTVKGLGNHIVYDHSTHYSYIEFTDKDNITYKATNVYVPDIMHVELETTGDFYFNYGIDKHAVNYLLALNSKGEKRASPHYYFFCRGLLILMLILTVFGIPLILLDWLMSYSRYKQQKDNLARLGFDEESCVVYGES